MRSFTYPSLASGAASAEQLGVGTLHDADAIVTSFATPTSATTKSGVGLNGVIAGANCLPWRGLTVTTTAQTAAYNTTDPIVATVEFTRRDGTAYQTTISAQLTAANGNETIDFSGPFQRVASIAIPAQLLGTGTLQFGVGDIYSRCDVPGFREGFQWVVGLGTGDIVVSFGGTTRDVLKVVEGREYRVQPSRILRLGTTAIFAVGME
jgi:hypothetical protein